MIFNTEEKKSQWRQCQKKKSMNYINNFFLVLSFMFTLRCFLKNRIQLQRAGKQHSWKNYLLGLVPTITKKGCLLICGITQISTEFGGAQGPCWRYHCKPEMITLVLSWHHLVGSYPSLHLPNPTCMMAIAGQVFCILSTAGFALELRCTHSPAHGQAQA